MRRISLAAVSMLLLVGLATPSVFGQRRLGPKARAGVTIGSGTAIGAGLGGLIRGKKGALIGALLGGGGTAAVYLLKTRDNRNNRERGYYNNGGNSYSHRRARRCR